MTEPGQIRLVTPRNVRLEPPDDRIVALSMSDLDMTRDAPRPELLGQGSCVGIIASHVLLEAIDNHDGETTLLLPLHSYGWLEILRDLPFRVLALVPAIGRGVLMVVPQQRLMDLRQPPQDGSVREDIVQFSRREFPMRLVLSSQPVASPIHPFVAPLLVSNTRGKHAWIRPTFDKLWLKEIEGDTPAATAIRAGVAQLNDLLEESHEFAQLIEGHSDGDYWHAIMHRREPDYGNSKYWFRHVGRHPVFSHLAPRAAAILKESPAEVHSQWASKLKVDAGWDPFAFVDMCEAGAANEDGDLGMAARRIQWLEMLLLLRHCDLRSESR